MAGQILGHLRNRSTISCPTAVGSLIFRTNDRTQPSSCCPVFDVEGDYQVLATSLVLKKMMVDPSWKESPNQIVACRLVYSVRGTSIETKYTAFVDCFRATERSHPVLVDHSFDLEIDISAHAYLQE